MFGWCSLMPNEVFTISTLGLREAKTQPKSLLKP
jgi:hypothetical protein